MASNLPRVPGRHFLQIPGPAPVPDRILRAMDKAVLDHRGPEFQQLGLRVLSGIKTIFKTKSHVFLFPASGTGAWEAALINALSPGDKILMFETGHFATLWKTMATKLGLKAEFIELDWRSAADPAAIEARLKEDKKHEIKAVCVVHNETSTGVTSNIADVRKAIDAARHPALFLVDTVSGLASVDFRMDEWGVDVTVSGSQKGLMLPPGIGLTGVSEKAMRAAKEVQVAQVVLLVGGDGRAKQERLLPLHAGDEPPLGSRRSGRHAAREGLDRVFARHIRHGEATRRAVRAWGLEILCKDPKAYSPVLTAILMPQGHDSDEFRKVALEHFDISLGAGLSKIAGKVFRIGHLGDTNDLTIVGALSGVEMSLGIMGVPYKKGGVQAAMDYLGSTAKTPLQSAAE